jgi:hypothetical protein
MKISNVLATIDEHLLKHPSLQVFLLEVGTFNIQMCKVQQDIMSMPDLEELNPNLCRYCPLQ